MYKFLIDENGDIYKCPYGIWKYDNIKDYVDGGFDKRFKEMGMAFYKSFFGSCRSCIRSYNKMFSKKEKGMTLSEYKKHQAENRAA